jgi:hypothetical protein
MRETKSPEQCQHMEEAGRRGHMHGRRHRRRAMMLLMPIMMVAPLCMHAAMLRRLKRIEHKLDDLERRNAVNDTAERA